MNPHLTPEKFDTFTHKWHCGECEQELGTYGNFIENIYLGTWHHHRYVDVPGVIARNENGMTIEGVWEKEPRRVLTKIPKLAAVHFHFHCLHLDGFLSDFDEDDNACAAYNCAKSVGEEYTQSTLLWLGKNNYKVIRRLNWHPECLPKIFEGV